MNKANQRKERKGKPVPESVPELAAAPRRVPVFRAADYGREAAHFTAAAALAFAAGVWVGPLTLLGCGAAAGLLTVGGSKLFDKILPAMFKKKEVAPGAAEGLAEAVRDFTPKAGLAAAPALYDFELNKEDLAKQNDINANPAQFQRVFNAAAAGLTRPVILISEPLLDVLEEGETRAVVAHEFGHLGGRHIRLGMAANWLQMTTMFAAMFGLGGAVVSEGWLTGLLSIGGTVAIAYGGSKVMPKKEDRYARDGTMKPGALRRQMMIWGAQEALSVGILAIPNPAAVLTAVAIEHGFFWAANFINKSLSRRHEFQADRAAIAMGANPLKLIAALRKIEALLELNDPALAQARDWRRGALPLRALKMAESIFKTHPDTQRRCRRLAALARQQGYAAEEISAALAAPVDAARLRALSDKGAEARAQEAAEKELRDYMARMEWPDTAERRARAQENLAARKAAREEADAAARKRYEGMSKSGRIRLVLGVLFGRPRRRSSPETRQAFERINAYFEEARLERERLARELAAQEAAPKSLREDFAALRGRSEKLGADIERMRQRQQARAPAP
jgi:heat shock protein HtpX